MNNWSKLLLVIFLNIFILTEVYCSERSEKERELGVFLEDLKEIGKYKKIQYSPEGLFPQNLNNFYAKSQKSKEGISEIFVKKKHLLNKYPGQMMLGMAYFEFFYMQQ